MYHIDLITETQKPNGEFENNYHQRFSGPEAAAIEFIRKIDPGLRYEYVVSEELAPQEDFELIIGGEIVVHGNADEWLADQDKAAEARKNGEISRMRRTLQRSQEFNKAKDAQIAALEAERDALRRAGRWLLSVIDGEGSHVERMVARVEARDIIEADAEAVAS